MLRAVKTLTALGQQFYAQGQIPEPPEERPLSLIYFGVTDQLEVRETPVAADEQDPIPPGFSGLSKEQVEADAILAASDLERAISATTAAALGLHAPGDGRIISELTNPSVEGSGFVQRQRQIRHTRSGKILSRRTDYKY